MKKTPIALGIAGLGRAGCGMHFKELDERRDKFRIVAGCDTIKTRRDKIGELYNGRAYRKIEDLISDPEVEMVDIATRNNDHVTHALAALRAGKMVFLEKPVGISYREASEIRKVSANSPGKLFIRFNRRFEAAFCQIREIIKTGIIGNVYEVSLRRNGFSRRDDWQAMMKCGGGQLLNKGPHIIDHALLFLDSPVTAVWGDLKRISSVGDAEDHVKIMLRGENKRLIDLEISSATAMSEPMYFIRGSRGTLTCDGNKIRLRYLDPEVKLTRRRAKSSTPELGSFGTKEELPWVDEERDVNDANAPHQIWDYLFASVREGAPYPITLEQALEVMKVISAVRKGTTFETAAARGRK